MLADYLFQPPKKCFLLEMQFWYQNPSSMCWYAPPPSNILFEVKVHTNTHKLILMANLTGWGSLSKQYDKWLEILYLETPQKHLKQLDI